MDSKISPLLGAGRVPETVGMVHVGPFQSCAPWAHSALLDGMLACHCEYSVLEFGNEVIFFTGSEEFKGAPGTETRGSGACGTGLSVEHKDGKGLSLKPNKQGLGLSLKPNKQGLGLSPKPNKQGLGLSPKPNKGGTSPWRV